MPLASDEPVELIRLLRSIDEKLDRIGVKIRPYTEHLFTKAVQPIDAKERVFDLQEPWDMVIVKPEIDAYIEFDKGITDNTPIITANRTFSAELRMRKIYYKAANPGETGNLWIWVFR